MDDDDNEGDSGEVFGSDEEREDDVPPAPKTKARKTSRKPASAAVSADNALAPPAQARSLTSKGKQAVKPTSKGRTPRRIKHVVSHHASVSSEEENFDLNAISSDDEPDNAPRIPITCRKTIKARSRVRQTPPVAGSSRMASTIENSGRSAEPHNVYGNDAPFAFIEDEVDHLEPPTPFQNSRTGKFETTRKEKGNATTSKDRGSLPRRKYRLKSSQRPNFNIFPDLHKDDASPYDDPSKPEAARFHISPSEHSEDIVLPDVPRIPENKRSRLVLEDGEIDFFDEASEALPDRGSPMRGPVVHNSSSRTKLVDRKGSPMALTRALSTLSVSSPASSAASSPVRGNRAVMDDDVDIIILSD
ncbi:hypothetical protein EWM64_g1224 [Hericium alpestre]|uniref:Uncharacterized protein n=1 Tax=Hericium alpestre TaxID=135208 RepID=A0A4Z0AA21_9AGAM|nr:hypothetical protein EWM64_g1224 [Hericium alpestre]